jgi:hypothetical protein
MKIWPKSNLLKISPPMISSVTSRELANRWLRANPSPRVIARAVAAAAVAAVRAAGAMGHRARPPVPRRVRETNRLRPAWMPNRWWIVSLTPTPSRKLREQAAAGAAVVLADHAMTKPRASQLSRENEDRCRTIPRISNQFARVKPIPMKMMMPKIITTSTCIAM